MSGRKWFLLQKRLFGTRAEELYTHVRESQTTIYCDGSSRDRVKTASCGGVMRNETGTVLKLFAKRLPYKPGGSSIAELEGVKLGFTLALQDQIVKPCLFTDSEQIRLLVTNQQEGKFQERKILQDIWDMKDKWKEEHVKIGRKNRTGNAVAHYMSLVGQSLSPFEMNVYKSVDHVPAVQGQEDIKDLIEWDIVRADVYKLTIDVKSLNGMIDRARAQKIRSDKLEESLETAKAKLKEAEAKEKLIPKRYP